jgi:hypothetical protein
MSNFSFLIKSSLMQVIFVSLGSVPCACLAVLVVTEGVYFLHNVVYYAKNRHLRSVFLILPKVIQSIFLLVVEISMLRSYFNLENPKFSLPISSQNFITQVIKISTIAEYGLLFINICVIIMAMVQRSQRKKKDPKFKDHCEK